VQVQPWQAGIVPADHTRAGLLEQWDLLARAIEAQPDAAFDAPTRLPGWTGALLVAHLTSGPASVTRALTDPAPAGRPLAVTDYYREARAAASAVDARARDAAGGRTPAELRVLLAGAVTEAREHLEGAKDDAVVATRLGPLRLVDFLATRSLEGVVHGLDLPVPVIPATTALRTSVRLLARTIAASWPGKSVEVRVPPHVAVQCLAGPRHTRGTPPNIVEAQPVAFVEVATGRRTWSAAVGDGSVTASGERSDLSGLLPIL